MADPAGGTGPDPPPELVTSLRTLRNAEAGRDAAIAERLFKRADIVSFFAHGCYRIPKGARPIDMLFTLPDDVIVIEMSSPGQETIQAPIIEIRDLLLERTHRDRLYKMLTGSLTAEEAAKIPAREYKKLSLALQTFHIYMPGQTIVNRPLGLETPLEPHTGIYVYPMGDKEPLVVTSKNSSKIDAIQTKIQKTGTTIKQYILEFEVPHAERKRGTIFFFTACGGLEFEKGVTKEEKETYKDLFETVQGQANLRSRTATPFISGGPGTVFQRAPLAKRDILMKPSIISSYAEEDFAPTAGERIFPLRPTPEMWRSHPFVVDIDKTYLVFTKDKEGRFKPIESPSEEDSSVFTQGITLSNLKQLLPLLPLYAQNSKGEMEQITLLPGMNVLIPYTHEAHLAFLKSLETAMAAPPTQTRRKKRSKLVRMSNLLEMTKARRYTRRRKYKLKRQMMSERSRKRWRRSVKPKQPSNKNVFQEWKRRRWPKK